MGAHLELEPGHKAKLQHRNPDATPGVKGKNAAAAALAKNMARPAELHDGYFLKMPSKSRVNPTWPRMSFSLINSVRLDQVTEIGTLTSELIGMESLP